MIEAERGHYRPEWLDSPAWFGDTAATTNLPLTGVGQTINGVVIEDGMYVLATAQTDPTENGVWVANDGPWLLLDPQPPYGHVVTNVATGAIYVAGTWSNIPTGGAVDPNDVQDAVNQFLSQNPVDEVIPAGLIIGVPVTPETVFTDLDIVGQVPVGTPVILSAQTDTAEDGLYEVSEDGTGLTNFSDIFVGGNLFKLIVANTLMDENGAVGPIIRVIAYVESGIGMASLAVDPAVTAAIAAAIDGLVTTEGLSVITGDITDLETLTAAHSDAIPRAGERPAVHVVQCWANGARGVGHNDIAVDGSETEVDGEAVTGERVYYLSGQTVTANNGYWRTPADPTDPWVQLDPAVEGAAAYLEAFNSLSPLNGGDTHKWIVPKRGDIVLVNSGDTYGSYFFTEPSIAGQQLAQLRPYGDTVKNVYEITGNGNTTVFNLPGASLSSAVVQVIDIATGGPLTNWVIASATSIQFTPAIPNETEVRVVVIGGTSY